MRNGSVIMFFVAACIWVFPVHAEERLWVDCKVNGQPVRLAFDTGASHLVLFTKTAHRLGLAVVYPTNAAPAASGLVLAGKSEESEFDLSGNVFRTQFRIYDIPGYLRTHADGLLGWGAFRGEIFQIDAANHAVATLRELPENVAGWTKLPLQTDADILTLSIPEGTRTNLVIIDTGSPNGISLPREQWRAWKSKHPNQRFTLNASFLPAVGLFLSEEAWADSVAIGPLVLRDIPVSEGSPEGAASAAKTVIGMAALKHLQLTVDGRQGAAYANVRKEPAPAYEHNRLGAVFSPRDPQKDTDLVAHVAAASPAEKAGIKAGDVLLKIGTLDATRWRTDPAVLPLSRFWNQPAGTHLRLTLRRDQRTNEVSVTLENILGPKPAKATGE